jgi:hypothetical protein
VTWLATVAVLSRMVDQDNGGMQLTLELPEKAQQG